MSTVALVVARRPVRACTGIVAAFLFIAACNPACAFTADSADDVCPSDADPCNVTSSVDIVNGSILDFGTRSVNVSGGGQFNVGSGFGTILCGPFNASTRRPAINASGRDSDGRSSGGAVRIHARRSCSIGNPKQPCIKDRDCQRGNCGVRRCVEQAARSCTSDDSCNLGACRPFPGQDRCTNDRSQVCDNDADCDVGPCSAQLTCSSISYSTVLICSTNTDCDLGSCSVGSASISMGGRIVGGAKDGDAWIDLHAADSIVISKPVYLGSHAPDGIGGDLELEAVAGSVTIAGRIRAPGRHGAEGGSVWVKAGEDAIVAADINVQGGGEVQIDAAHDIAIDADIRADGLHENFDGGHLAFESGRDLVIGGAPSSDRILFSTNGHTDNYGSEVDSGDGGRQIFVAGRDLTLDEKVRLRGIGPPPVGDGGSMFLGASRDLVVDGDIAANGRGFYGGGGSLVLDAGGALSVGSDSAIDLTGPYFGGHLEIESTGDIEFSGACDTSSPNGKIGQGGDSSIHSDGDVTIFGTLTNGGGEFGDLNLSACRVTLSESGQIRNRYVSRRNSLLARESMNLLAGSSLIAEGGQNILTYRTPAKPPVTEGVISPAPLLNLDPTLTGCPVCGNAEIDENETCDDGNSVGGDGCNSSCLSE